MKPCGLCKGKRVIEGIIEEYDECPACTGTGLAPIPNDAERDTLKGFQMMMSHCDMETHEETGLCECFERLLNMLRSAKGIHYGS